MDLLVQCMYRLTKLWIADNKFHEVHKMGLWQSSMRENLAVVLQKLTKSTLQVQTSDNMVLVCWFFCVFFDIDKWYFRTFLA